MIKWRSWLLIIAAHFLTIGLLPTHAKAQEEPRDTLRDVNSVSVLVIMDDDLGFYVSESRLQTVAELALRQAGLVVIDGGPQLDGLLLFTFTAVPDRIGGDPIAFSVARRLEFHQWVMIPRIDASFVVPTWQTGGVSYWGTDRVREAAERTVLEAIDNFLNDWLSVR